LFRKEKEAGDLRGGGGKGAGQPREARNVSKHHSFLRHGRREWLLGGKESRYFARETSLRRMPLALPHGEGKTWEGSYTGRVRKEPTPLFKEGGNWRNWHGSSQKLHGFLELSLNGVEGANEKKQIRRNEEDKFDLIGIHLVGKGIARMERREFSLWGEKN